MQFDDKYLAKSTAIASRALGDETIIMSTADSTLFTLNATATAIWEAADGRTPLSRVLEEKVCVEFEVSAEQAWVDALELIDKLSAHGLLRISDQPIPE
jgi:hypothetical protein